MEEGVSQIARYLDNEAPELISSLCPIKEVTELDKNHISAFFNFC
jgi:hypothetical protein